MVPGSNWKLLMHRAVRHAERTIAVLSADYLQNSEFGAAEWAAAFRADPRGLAGRLIPVRVEDCAGDGLLAGIVHTDLFGLSAEAARARLLETVAAALSGR